MEVKINREIREFTEAIFFGLSLRQTVCSGLAAASAVGTYFLLEPHLGNEIVSWLCVVAAVPFGAMGFVRYHGMTAEQFFWAWIRSELLTPKHLVFRANNIYYEAMRVKPTKKDKKKVKAEHE